MSELYKELLGFAAGLLTGLGLPHIANNLVGHLKPQMSPQSLSDLANELDETALKLHALARVARSLSQGDDLETMEAKMPAELKQAWDKWKEDNRG